MLACFVSSAGKGAWNGWVANLSLILVILQKLDYYSQKKPKDWKKKPLNIKSKELD